MPDITNYFYYTEPEQLGDPERFDPEPPSLVAVNRFDKNYNYLDTLDCELNEHGIDDAIEMMHEAFKGKKSGIYEVSYSTYKDGEYGDYGHVFYECDSVDSIDKVKRLTVRTYLLRVVEYVYCKLIKLIKPRNKDGQNKNN